MRSTYPKACEGSELLVLRKHRPAVDAILVISDNRLNTCIHPKALHSISRCQTYRSERQESNRMKEWRGCCRRDLTNLSLHTGPTCARCTSIVGKGHIDIGTVQADEVRGSWQPLFESQVGGLVM